METLFKKFPLSGNFLNENLYARFCKYVHIKEDHQCWPWVGAMRAKNVHYGQLLEFRNGKRITHASHRLAWKFAFGEIPDGLIVRHLCHNSKCCNPIHLALGTHKDNFNDKIKAARQGDSVMLPGEQNRNAKLSDCEVLDIINSNRKSIRALAREYGVSKSLISLIRRREVWRHL